MRKIVNYIFSLYCWRIFYCCCCLFLAFGLLLLLLLLVYVWFKLISQFIFHFNLNDCVDKVISYNVRSNFNSVPTLYTPSIYRIRTLLKNELWLLRLIVFISEVISDVKHEETQREKDSGNSVKDVNFTIRPKCKTKAGNALYDGCSRGIGRVRTVLNSWTRHALK